MSESAILTHDLSKSFGTRIAVDQLTMTVHAGSVYGLLGPNGAGKTTTVRMLAGLIAPSSGAATVGGLSLRQDEAVLSALHRRVGLLTETPGMWDRLSAARNLLVHARLHGLRDPEATVERYLRRMGLWERRADPAARLSKGMRQRLALARAMLHEPPILFLDEPTSGLDPEAAAEVRELIGELRGEGRAILLCTHNLEEAEKLSDRLGIFRTRLLLEGTAAELRRGIFGEEVAARFRLPDGPEPHLSAARRVEGVIGARGEGELLIAEVVGAEQVLPRLARVLVEDGAELLYIGERHRPLEEVYLHVLEHNGA